MLSDSVFVRITTYSGLAYFIDLHLRIKPLYAGIEEEGKLCTIPI